ncbi:MAG: helix-turn-helix domain-containing protein [Bacteriovoracaceae bacterium]|nr:helix-turn-helix domain-containing protein [Bacteriovoracaceae bacterium]
MKLKKKNRRSDMKVITKEGKILKFFRESRKLSMRQAARVIGVSEATVNHTENGRKDLTPHLILKFLNGYGYSLVEFKAFFDGKVELPENILFDCIGILKRLEPAKLKTVKTILQSF